MAEKGGIDPSKITLDDIDWLALYALSIKHEGSQDNIMEALCLRAEGAVSEGNMAKAKEIARTMKYLELHGEKAVSEAEERYIASRVDY